MDPAADADGRSFLLARRPMDVGVVALLVSIEREWQWH